MRVRVLGALLTVALVGGGAVGCSAGPSKEEACAGMLVALDDFSSSLYLNVATTLEQAAENARDASAQVEAFAAVEVPEELRPLHGEMREAMIDLQNGLIASDEDFSVAATERMHAVGLELDAACA